MTSEQVAKRLIELVNQGKNTQAQEELYADDIVNYEQDGRVTKGKPAVMEKTKASASYYDEFYGTKITMAYVSPEAFLLQLAMDFKPKGGERTQIQEWGFYKVKEGKVVEEYFFMQPLAL